MALIIDSYEPVRRLLLRRGIAIDPMYRGEIRRLAENPGIRMRYMRSGGMLLDDIGEALWDAGFTYRRVDCNEALEIVEAALYGKRGDQ